MKSLILFPLLTSALTSKRDVPVALPLPIIPKREPSAPGVTRATARFGPFTLPSNEVTGGSMRLSGLLSKYLLDLPMPCTSGCTYTYIHGDMAYENGTSANVNNGAYMHHISLMASPRAGSASRWGESSKPFYEIGNERVALSYPNAGVYLSKYATIVLGVELQNQEAGTKKVYIDLDYDYLPGQPAGYTDIIPVDQDALSRSGQIKQAGTWERTSPAYIVNQDARLLMAYGHLHDGGIRTEIKVNNKTACNSVAVYTDMKEATGLTGSSMEMAGGHSHGGKVKRDGAPSHIIKFTECKEMGNVKKGDRITTKVYYDFTRRPATPLPNGKEDPL